MAYILYPKHTGLSHQYASTFDRRTHTPARAARRAVAFFCNGSYMAYILTLRFSKGETFLSSRDKKKKKKKSRYVRVHVRTHAITHARGLYIFTHLILSNVGTAVIYRMPYKRRHPKKHGRPQDSGTTRQTTRLLTP